LDIKPENFVISQQGSVKLIDFGFSRFLSEGEQSIGLDGIIYGTKGYIAKEVFEENDNVSLIYIRWFSIIFQYNN